MVRLPKLTEKLAFTFCLQHNIRIHAKVTKDFTKFYYRISNTSTRDGTWNKFATHYLRYCPACEEQQPNQMAHMNPGYCLSEEWMATPFTFFKFEPNADHLLTFSQFRSSKLQRLLESIERRFRWSKMTSMLN